MRKPSFTVICLLLLFFSFHSLAIAHFSSVEEYPLSLQVDSIILETYNGSITWVPVRPRRQPRILVEKEVTGSSPKVIRRFLNHIEIESERSRSQLKLKAIEPVHPPGVTSSKVHFTVYASPRDIFEFQAKTNNSPITIEVDFNGSLHLTTNNAPIFVRSGRGQLTLLTSNDAIELGRIDLTDSSTIQTANGSITGTVSFPEQGLFVFQNSNGPIDLRMPSNTFGSFNLITSVGSVNFRLGRDYSSGQQVVSINRGRGPAIQIMSSNSDITVRDTHRF